MNGEKKLTPKQQKFVQEYLIDRNATQAAIRAGYSAKSARQQAVYLLSNINVSTYINDLLNKSMDESGITREKKRSALWSVVEKVLSNPEIEYTVQSMVAAIKELNEMDGDHASKKVDLNIYEGLADYLQAAINERRNSQQTAMH